MSPLGPTSAPPGLTVGGNTWGGGGAGSSLGGSAGGANPSAPAQANIDVYNVANYAVPVNGAAAVAALQALLVLIGAAPAVMYIPVGATIGLDANLVIPSNVQLWVGKGARFRALAAGLTLTLNGELQAPNDRIFDNSANIFTVALGARHELVRPEWWGALGDGVTDSTAAIQAAINAAKSTRATVTFLAATYKVTAPLLIYNGSQLRGVTRYQYPAGFAIDPKGTRINFAPGVLSNLFDPSGANLFHISIDGFYFSGDGGVFARYSLNVDSIIYGRFANIASEGFQYGVRCNGTINNRFENVWSSGTVGCVLYAGAVETTDVWNQCTFYGPSAGGGTPIGVKFLGSSINIRFNHCLWEQINDYGMEIARECQNIVVVNGYCEDVPFAGNANGCMFRVGYTGAVLVADNQLTVIGGKYAGRNAGTVGSFVDCDFSNGVMLVAPDIARFTNVVRTTANTRANSVFLSGLTGTGWASFINDITKLSGLFPNGVLNSGANHHNARLASVLADSVTVASTLFVPIFANVNLPAAGAANNGLVVLDSTNHRIVYYENNLRYFVPIGTSF